MKKLWLTSIVLLCFVISAYYFYAQGKKAGYMECVSDNYYTIESNAIYSDVPDSVYNISIRTIK